MDGNTNSFGIRGFLIDTPEFGTLRGRPTGALIIDNGRITERGDYDVLRRVQRRTPRTVLGHCIHLNSREIAAIAAAQSSVAHCPTSNLFLGSGLIKLDQMLKMGIAVGLGSDVAGGTELNMWQVIHAAIDVQKARATYEPNLRPLQTSEAFYLATHGGARAVGKAGIIGTLDAGKEADFIVVDLASFLPYPKNREALGELSTEDALALCIYRGGPQANLETYVRGKCIYQGPALAQSS